MLHEGLLIFPHIILLKYFYLALYYRLFHLLFQLVPLNYAHLIGSALWDLFSIVLLYQFLCPVAIATTCGMTLWAFSNNHLFGTAYKDILIAMDKLDYGR